MLYLCLHWYRILPVDQGSYSLLQQQFRQFVEDSTYEELTDWIKDPDSKLQVIQNLSEQLGLQKEIALINQKLEKLKEHVGPENQNYNPLTIEQEIILEKEPLERVTELNQLILMMAI